MSELQDKPNGFQRLFGPRRAAHDGSEKLNLRPWFYGFLAYTIGLTLTARIAFGAYSGGGGQIAFQIWALSLFLFYMSLCCTFFPAPTTFMVLGFGSPIVGLIGPAQAAGLGETPLVLLTATIVAAVGALGTGLANLNEYHIWTFLLRFRPLGRVRQTRTHERAAEWFARAPFLVLAAISFIPIPVDVVRWLAISSRYQRGRYFLAYFCGRFVRYFLIAGFAAQLQMGVSTIIAIQGLLILLALTRGVPKLIRWMRKENTEISD